MLHLAPTDEQRQLCDAVRGLLTKECTPDRVRAAEASGHDQALWDRCRELVPPEIALPGGGGTLLDVAQVAGLLGEFLAPVPLLDTVPAARAAAALGADPASVLTLAPRPPVDGVLVAVPSGAVADHVLFRDGDQLRITTDPVPDRPAPNLGGLAVADRSTAGSRMLAAGPDAAASHATAVAEWKALLAAWLTGAGRRALRLGVDYAGQREAFGVKVGTFQAIAHRLADVATALDAAGLLAWEAAWAFDRRPAEAPVYASMALIQAADAAAAATRESLHVFGGYGFMLEYDIQLYFRRVKAAGLLVGDLSREPEHLADLLWGVA